MCLWTTIMMAVLSFSLAMIKEEGSDTSSRKTHTDLIDNLYQPINLSLGWFSIK